MDLHPSVRRLLESPVISQKSPEWFAYRRQRVTASEVSTILAQGRGAKSLMMRKKFETSSGFSTEYTRIGSENEERVVELYREKFPGVIVFHDLSIIPHKIHDFIAASLDACTSSGIVVEIKTCFKDSFVKVSKAYFDQVQLQMEVAGLEMTHLVQHYINMPGQPIKIHEIARDRDWFKRSVPILKKFIDDMKDLFQFDMIIVEFQMAKFQGKSSRCRDRHSDIRIHSGDRFLFDLKYLR